MDAYKVWVLCIAIAMVITASAEPARKSEYALSLKAQAAPTQPVSSTPLDPPAYQSDTRNLQAILDKDKEAQGDAKPAVAAAVRKTPDDNAALQAILDKGRELSAVSPPAPQPVPMNPVPIPANAGAVLRPASRAGAADPDRLG